MKLYTGSELDYRIEFYFSDIGSKEKNIPDERKVILHLRHESEVNAANEQTECRHFFFFFFFFFDAVQCSYALDCGISWVYCISEAIHYENTPIQIYRKIHVQKLNNFRYKKTLIFFIFLLKT